MVRDLAESIVINLGSEVNDDGLVTGKIRSVPGDAVSASNSNVFEEEDIEDCSFGQLHKGVMQWRRRIASKNRMQRRQ